MSLHLPARQAANAARASIIAPPSARLNYLLPRTQRRNAWFPNFFGRKKESQPGSASSSPLAKELTRKEKEVRVAERLTKRTQGATIFDDDIEEADKKVRGSVREADSDYKRQTTTYSLVKEHMERALDPDPRWRVRYQKKMVMNMVRSKGKLSKKEQLKFTEKEFWSSSDPVPTSTKKLGFLARQVAGKTVEEAITQMRFSSKKMAREVLFELEKSRDAAISIRGMGLGTHSNEIHPKRNIVTKDGKKLQIDDPTRLYVDQAWVNKGPIRSIGVKYHARGRMSQLKRPSTRINVVLKEENTRIRLHEERVAKEVKMAPWVHLPNRPVTAQRQYYSW